LVLFRQEGIIEGCTWNLHAHIGGLSQVLKEGLREGYVTQAKTEDAALDLRGKDLLMIARHGVAKLIDHVVAEKYSHVG
jgi:hypothetical protein